MVASEVARETSGDRHAAGLTAATRAPQRDAVIGAVDATSSAKLPARNTHIVMVAGEASGDRLGAGLIAAIRARRRDIVISGVGGARMVAAGLDAWFDMSHLGVIGLDGLAAKLPGILRLRRALVRRLSAAPPAVFVGIDAPDFNLPLAHKLRRRGITCAHYVSPTVWAWRGYRIHKIRRAVDHMLTLFPFEAEYYRRHGVAVTYVGHPMADEIGTADRAAARRELGLVEDGGGGDSSTKAADTNPPPPAPVIALLPGSRRSEIRQLGALLVAAARLLLALYPRARFVLPFADHDLAAEFARVAGDTTDLPLTTVHRQSRRALAACDVAILASGTAALEAALLRRAHIVVYKLAAPSYHLMRLLTQVDYYSMPNHLLPTPMVPELIQHHATAANIAKETAAMLGDPARVSQLERHFADLHHQLKRGADAGAAAAVLRLADGGR